VFSRRPRTVRPVHNRPLAILTVVLVLASVAGVFSPAPQTAFAASATTTADLNLRAAASLSSAVLLVMPAGASVETLGSPEDGFYPVSYGGTRGYAYGAYLSIGGTTDPPVTSGPGTGSARTTTELNLRAGPNLSSDVLLVMPGGASVTVTGGGQNGFVPVTYGGTSGWAYASYLTSGGGTPDPEPTAPPAAGPSGTAVTTADLNLRSAPTTASAVLVVMPYGATVNLAGQTQSGFHAVRYGSIEGWAHGDYLAIGGTSEPAPTPPPPAPEQGPTGTYYTTADLNLRSGPSTSTSVITVMPRGAALTVTGSSQAGFYSATYNGSSGWAYASYLTTSAPQTPVPTTPPSNGGSEYTEAQIIAIIYAAADRYGQPRADMVRVARCESLLDPNAVNPAGSYGLFQFITSTWASTPYAAYDIFDPWASANAAGWMWSVGRRNEWVCQ
jgi:uncharacterized protein YraI